MTTPSSQLPSSVTDVLPADLLQHLENSGWTAPQVVSMFGLVRSTLDEDLAWGPDVTSNSTIDAGQRSRAHVVARGNGCISGVLVAAIVPYIAQVLLTGETEKQKPGITVELHCMDGTRVRKGDAVMTVNGPTRTILTAERTLLNFLCHLSGVATQTAQWVDAISTVDGAHMQVRDTRKTMPGLRLLQKQAVVHGGGTNHRMGLGDAALIKDNHIAAVGSLSAAFNKVRDAAPNIPIEVECDTLEQVQEAVDAGVDLVLLDNMDTLTIGKALEITRPAGVKTEASGGLIVERAARYASTGVDYIAVGALTHSAKVLDLGLDFEDGSR